jgi:8-oxo-dGTP diphosphatase
VQGVVAVIEQQGRLLVIRRAPDILAGGNWCFPGGGVEPGEPLPDAIVREVREELGVPVEPLQEIWTWRRPDGLLVLSWWKARLIDASAAFHPAPAEVAEVCWATPAEIRALSPILPSNLAFVDHFWPS